MIMKNTVSYAKPRKKSANEISVIHTLSGLILSHIVYIVKGYAGVLRFYFFTPFFPKQLTVFTVSVMIFLNIETEIEVAFFISKMTDVPGTEELIRKGKMPKGQSTWSFVPGHAVNSGMTVIAGWRAIWYTHCIFGDGASCRFFYCSPYPY